MLDFIVAWVISAVGVRIYLGVKDVKIGINNDIVALSMSFVIVAILGFMQWLVDLILSVIL